MQNISSLQPTAQLVKLLKTARNIAVVGLSRKENRPSNMVARYLLAAGYRIFPVNPGQDEILGLPCYPSLAAVPGQIDIVDIFRNPADVLPIVEEALGLSPLPQAIWMQQGIVNREAAEYARRHGLIAVMDRCIKVDHSLLL